MIARASCIRCGRASIKVVLHLGIIHFEVVTISRRKQNGFPTATLQNHARRTMLQDTSAISYVNPKGVLKWVCSLFDCKAIVRES